MPVPPPQKMSTSRDLVVTRRAAPTKDNNGSRDQTSITSRALVLRNGKYGSMGTGEVTLARKMSGREKLELLAEEQMRSALRAPFDLELCLKIARARMDVYLDDISHLHDIEFCYGVMQEELKANMPPADPNDPDPMNNPTWIAKHFAARVHNTYMLASAWKMVLNGLLEVQERCPNDKNIRSRLTLDDYTRDVYLEVYKMMETIVMIGQHRLRLLAQNTPHYAPFFRVDRSNPDEPKVQFNWNELGAVYKSFVDSIVIELCLPGSPFPLPVLYSSLHDFSVESPKELERFPQAMWDAVGDLADAVQVLDLLDGPLLTPHGQKAKGLAKVPSDFEKCQFLSFSALQKVSKFKSFVCPLANLRTKANLDKVWSCINSNCMAESGKEIDKLWELTEARKRRPEWRTYTFRNRFLDAIGESSEESESDSDSDGPPFKASPFKKKKKPKKVTAGPRRRLITAGGEDSDGPPPLVSASSDDDSGDQFDSDSSDEGSDSDDDIEYAESGYDSEEEAMMKEMVKEALAAAHDNPDIFEQPKHGKPDKYEAERRQNPFLKLLGSLRGRMFTSNPAAKIPDSKTFKPSRPSSEPPSEDDLPPLVPINAPKAPQQQSRKVTVEEVEDEEETKKKKKKKKKSKKKTSSAGQDESQPKSPTTEASPPVTSPPTSPVIPRVGATSPASTTTPVKAPPAQRTVSPAQPTSPSKDAKKAPSKVSTASSPVTSPSLSSSTPTLAPHTSTTSLALPHEQTAQSAHSYLQSTGANASKTKVKSRPDHVPVEPENKKSLFSRFNLKSKDKEEPPVPASSKKQVFGNLTKKASSYMAKLIGTSVEDKRGMLKWDEFVKVMHQMGFKYVESTAGSSVRFDPPDPRDPPITFHKGHPDPTLHRNHLRDFGKRLKEKYGWTEEMLAEKSTLKAFRGKD
ncbi:hypothetical protein BD410DRAFT_895610 [Rickenella mellea]|uniref:Uncharacterized protein n=1 Tax=Rickenella mellea TaxID=50990 RepID=A0A4Y7QG73_9AGAM|nr:hypothetical protein BD410DRAFT_895610 [Rickenella mellea]